VTAVGRAVALDARVSVGARREARTPDFQALLGEGAWEQLPAAVQARFDADSHRAPRTFLGAMDVRMNWLGWVFAQGGRLLGAPLAPWAGEAVAVNVLVRRDPSGGVRWERIYAYPGRAPLSIVSMKLIAADGSLLEVTRGGIGMRLTLGVEAGALVFRSNRYFWRIGPWIAPLPVLLTPGRCTVVHRDLGGGRFRFGLAFRHPLAGETLVNVGDFQDPPEARP
jgi:Domain of unknown function (DUF4166)